MKAQIQPQLKPTLTTKLSVVFRKITLTLATSMLAGGVSIFYITLGFMERSLFAYAVALFFFVTAFALYMTDQLIKVLRKYNQLLKENLEREQRNRVMMRIHEDL